jgi:hypothetical protein
MKKILTLCAVVLLAGLAGIITGCSSGSKGAVADLMKVVPQKFDVFYYLDVATMRSDSDLKTYYETSGVTQELEVTGLDISTVRSVAMSGMVSSQVYVEVVSGDFNLSQFRDKMGGLGFTSSTYNGIEVWKLESEQVTVALVSDRIVIISTDEASVQSSIDVVKSGASSLLDNKDYRDVVSRMPAGILVTCSNTFSPFGIQDVNPAVTGYSAAKKDKDTLVMTGILKFGDNNAAQAAVPKIKAGMEQALTDASVIQDGKSVKFTGDVPMSDFMG